ncbi:hypothetical protein GCM10010399_67100 [Dactylosporangium fulvum]|uniref:DUF3592 domain-containing protein n=1 Tax=Dactylosporangium fulvum TaxID=53359 RepID=A0ABY5VZ39_9ACTN|nr:hypothetical protein [Dactylosporangium fulvum]UWP83047.1 hypothetical protein Dfulv_01685 [Dactylosporangium fulvum]
MAGDVDDRRGRVLVAAIAMSAMLFMVPAASVLGTFWFRNGTFGDGVVVTAHVLKVSPGRTGEAEVEYVADGNRHQQWISCGTSCPRAGDWMEVEYSAGDPRQVARNRMRPYSSTAVVALFVTGAGIVVCGILLRRSKGRGKGRSKV